VAGSWQAMAGSVWPVFVLALCVTASVSVQECGGGNSTCNAPEAEVRIVSPAEGEALTARLPAGAAAHGRVEARGIVEIEARGAFAKVALYLDGQFVSTTLLGAAIGRVELDFPLPSGAEACGRWHFVEVALMDAEDWRLENPEAAASVRFTLGCAGHSSSAAAQHAAAAREEREKRERAQVFEGIYESFGWEPSADSSKETRSGPGSYVARTNASRAFLSDVLRRFNVGSVLDAGCGDVNWQGLTPGIDEVDYFGIDIVPQMIADNVRRLGGPGRRMRFAVKDVVKDDLGGPYDLVLCRDTLFHLPLWDAVQALRNLQATGARYFMSHYDEDLNTNWPDIAAGGWHMINLLAPPFKLPPPLLSVPEAGNEGDAGAMAHYGQSRKLGLWEFPVLPPVPSTRSASSSSPADTTSVAFSTPADTGAQEEGSGPDAGAPREGGGDAGAEHALYGWVGQKHQHTLKRCVLVAPGRVESVGGQSESARHQLPPRGQWWPVDVIFSIAGGVAGLEGGRGVVNEVPAHGENGRVDEALLSAASSLGVEIVGNGGNVAGAKASGGARL
jgi:SAM-dependent methyltransferase